MEVYADVMFLVNTMVNSMLLVVTAAASRRRVTLLKILLSSTFSALAATVLFFFELSIIIQIILSLLLAAMTIMICFSSLSPRRLMKPYFLFLFFSLVFYAVCSAVATFTAVPMFSLRGVVYLDISSWLLMALSTVGFILSFIYVKLSTHTENSRIYLLKIKWEGKCITVNALLDTGNNATDFLSNLPVIILAQIEAAKLLGEGVPVIADGNASTLLAVAEKKLRFIPYGGIWCETGLMPCFHPESVTVISPKGKIYTPDAIIGITQIKLSLCDEYSALIGGGVFQ